MTPRAALLRWAWPAVFLVAAAWRIGTALKVSGIYADDEIMQYLETAHRLAFGHGIITWEWELGVRHWFFPAVNAAWLWLFDALGISSGNTMFMLLRVIYGLLSLLAVVAVYQIGRKWQGEWVGLGAALAVAVWSPWVNLSVRVLSDDVSAALALWGLWLLCRAESETDRRWPLWAGVFAGLSYAVRLQTPLVFAVPVIYWLGERRWRQLGWLGLGAAGPLLMTMIVDLAVWGAPWHTPVAYLRENILAGRAASYGIQPYDGYLVEQLHHWGYYFPLFLFLWLTGYRGLRWVGPAVALVFVATSLIGHKEYRFLAPIIPLLLLMQANGVKQLIASWPGKARAAAVLVLLALFCWQSRQQGQLENWDRLGRCHQAIAAAVNEPGVTGLLITEGYWKAGGYFMTHRNYAAYFIDQAKAGDLERALVNPALNVAVISPDAEPAWPPVAQKHGFQPGARFGGYRLWRRAAQPYVP